MIWLVARFRGLALFPRPVPGAYAPGLTPDFNPIPLCAALPQHMSVSLWLTVRGYLIDCDCAAEVRA